MCDRRPPHWAIACEGIANMGMKVLRIPNIRPVVRLTDRYINPGSFHMVLQSSRTRIGCKRQNSL